MRFLGQPSQGSVWDSVRELTKLAQEHNSDPHTWMMQVRSRLNVAGVQMPSAELGDLLVSHLCFENHLPITWKLLEKALTAKLAPPVLVLALLSVRVIPNRWNYPGAYRLHLELIKRHAFSFSYQMDGSNFQLIMKLIDDTLHLSQVFGLQACEPGILLVEFVFSVAFQLVDASLDDEGLLEHTLEKQSLWLTNPQEMQVDSCDTFDKKRNPQHDVMRKQNTTMAIEIIGEFLHHKITSNLLYLVQQNMSSHWRCFIERLQLLLNHSIALKCSQLPSYKILLQRTSENMLNLLFVEPKRNSKSSFLSVAPFGSLLSSNGHSIGGAGRSALWLPFDLFLEDAVDGSQVRASSAIFSLTGLVKALRAVNGASWHDTFLGLWLSSLRLVQRERNPSDDPVPRTDASLCMLLSITVLTMAHIIEEEESKPIDKNKSSPRVQTECRMGLVSSLQLLGDFTLLLSPPQIVITEANQAAAKASILTSGLAASNAYNESLSMNDMPIFCAGNMWHLIVEACIARNMLDTSAYLWPGYVNTNVNQIPHGVLNQVPGWSAFMKGMPLTPPLTSTLVATPASNLAEIEKVFEVAIKGSDDEKISAASILCGASIIRGWNIQEHAILFIISLLSPPPPPDCSGSDTHLINCAPLLNVLLVGISSFNCVQILSLHGFASLLAGALIPICEIFGSISAEVSWTLATGEELSSHAMFSNAFILLLRLWRFYLPPFEHIAGDVKPVGSQLSPDYLISDRNSFLAQLGTQLNDVVAFKRFSKIATLPREPISMDSFPNFELWYQTHLECITSPLSTPAHGSPFHQIIEALLRMMFKTTTGRGGQPSASNSGSANSSHPEADDTLAGLRIPAWNILGAVPHVLDAALAACEDGKLSPRELATGLKVLADFLPASLATIVSYFSAEVARGIWTPAVMNGTDWPSPAPNLSHMEQQMKKILAATGVDLPKLTVGGSGVATLPLPLAALVSLTITYKLNKTVDQDLALIGPALNSLSAGCPWPCMPVVASLWAQKVKRWSDYFVFSASSAVFNHDNDAVAQLLKSCFTATLGLSNPCLSNGGGVGALLGHAFGFGPGSLVSGGEVSAVAPGILYLRAYPFIRDAMFTTEAILSHLMRSVADISKNEFAEDAAEKVRKTKRGMRDGRVSVADATNRVRLAASLGASLVFVSGGPTLVETLIKEIVPSWLVSARCQAPPLEGGGLGGATALLRGYALAYFVALSGAFAWGLDPAAAPLPAERRSEVLGMHLQLLASVLQGETSLACDWPTACAYASGLLRLIVTRMPAWLLGVDAGLLRRLSKGLRKHSRVGLALELLGHGGVDAMGAAAALIIEVSS